MPQASGNDDPAPGVRGGGEPGSQSWPKATQRQNEALDLHTGDLALKPWLHNAVHTEGRHDCHRKKVTEMLFTFLNLVSKLLHVCIFIVYILSHECVCNA